MPFRETPLRKVLVKWDDAEVYALDVGTGDITLHLHVYDMTKRQTREQFRRFQEAFAHIVVEFQERGIPVKTWVGVEDDEQFKLASFFGFRPNGSVKIIKMHNGIEYAMEEMEFQYDH